MKKLTLITATIAIILVIIPPQFGKSQSESRLQKRLDNIQLRTDKIDDKLNQIVEVDVLPKPKERKPKTVYRTKTKIKTVKVDRKVLVKVDNIYFEIAPEVDEQGNYIVDWDIVRSEKESTWKRLKLKKERPKRWYQRIF